MSIEIFHQLGFRQNWNFDSFEDDSVGSGFIFASSHMQKTDIENTTDEYKQISIFDPQFFLPNTPKRNLITYDFFPDNLSDGFQTNEYIQNHSQECAIKCLEFQKENHFIKYVIPTRYIPGMPTDFITQQQELFINPFLKAASKIGIEKKLILQLIVNNEMIKDKEYSTDLLNWITGFRDICGVYLIAEISPRHKQIKEIEFLYNYLHFVNFLVQNELYVLLGYQNTESLLLTIANPNAITIGSYENLRMFNIRNFEETEKDHIRGPNARIYSSTLIQWVDVNYLGALKRAFGSLDVFDDNHYRALMFQPGYRWHFSKPDLYKHYFLIFSNQIQRYTAVNGIERFKMVIDSIKNAISYYEKIQKMGVYLDSDSDGSHLAPWLTAASQFGADQGWN